MFDVLPQDTTIEGNGRDYIFIKKNCACAPTIKMYLSNTTFNVRGNNGSVHDMVVAYNGLAYFSSNFIRVARKSAVVSLRLMCGCSSGLWNYMMSYVLRDGDSVESLASRFGASMDIIVTVNGLNNPENFISYIVKQLQYGSLYLCFFFRLPLISAINHAQFDDKLQIHLHVYHTLPEYFNLDIRKGIVVQAEMYK